MSFMCYLIYDDNDDIFWPKYLNSCDCSDTLSSVHFCKTFLNIINEIFLTIQNKTCSVVLGLVYFNDVFCIWTEQ